MAGYITPNPVCYINDEEIQQAVEHNGLALELTRLSPYEPEQVFRRIIPLESRFMCPLINQLREYKIAYKTLHKTSVIPQKTISSSDFIWPDDVIREISRHCDRKTKAQTLILTKKGLVPEWYYKDALSDRKKPLNLKKIEELLEKHPNLMKTQTSLSVVCNLTIPNTDLALQLLTHKFKNITELFIESRKLRPNIHGIIRYESNLEMANSSLKILSLSTNDFFQLKTIPESVEELTLTSHSIDNIERSTILSKPTTLSKLKKLTLGLTLNYIGKQTTDFDEFKFIISAVIASKVMDVTYNLGAKNGKVDLWDSTTEFSIEELAGIILLSSEPQLQPGQKITVNYDNTENGVKRHKTISITKEI